MHAFYLIQESRNGFIVTRDTVHEIHGLTSLMAAMEHIAHEVDELGISDFEIYYNG